MLRILVVLAVAVASPALGNVVVQLDSILPSMVRPIPRDLSGERIVGGDEAAPGQFPHQVGIFIQTSGGEAFCGGSLLTSNIVITAAHCAQPGKHFRIVFGAHKIREDQEVVRFTTKKLVHEDYQDDGAISNDIALLYFENPVEFNDRIQPIRLPSKEQAGQSFHNQMVVASGWGRDSDAASGTSDVLRFVKSRVVTNLYCKFRYFFQFVRDTNICISGWWAKGTCNGDSGGPLVVYEADGTTPTLVGLTSFGIGFGCQVSWPPAFTRVSSYLDWIEKGIQIISFDH